MSLGGLSPVCVRLDTGRWHFQHGPIDLILDMDAPVEVCERSIAACWQRFQSVLTQLVAELPQLREPAHKAVAMRGPVAARMLQACAAFAAERFITPMAAVAGAVADELIEHCKGPDGRRAFINNGGDIALHLTPGASYRVGICSNIERARASPDVAHILDSAFVIDATVPVRGVATSGWRGRSLSLGIADSVTVLAHNAAAADAAATMIANAVDCDFPGIIRMPANQLKDDTDLGSLPVTIDVPPLPPEAVAAALESGRAEAQHWRTRGSLYAAALFLQGEVQLVLPPSELVLPAAAAQHAFRRMNA
jgi:ApbE superfamily uncharacterized protein (UPF0280 family)